MFDLWPIQSKFGRNLEENLYSVAHPDKARDVLCILCQTQFMKLDEFLRTQGLSKSAFARCAGLTVSTVHRAAAGKVTPSRQTIQAIVVATEGVVQPNDFFAPVHSDRSSADETASLGSGMNGGGRYRVGVDIGGTFTDLMLIDRQNGEIHVAKVPSTPSSLADGVLTGLARLGRSQRAIEMLVHGTTVGLNAFLERKGSLTGLITTRGFRDVPEIGRHNRLETYDLFYLKPVPLVARRHRLEVRERIGPNGDVLEPLDERDVESCVEAFRREGVTTIAICLLHSYMNPVHEERVAALLAELYPEANVSASSSLVRQWREFERGSTTIINAFVMSVVGSYLEALQDSLVREGYERPLFVSQSAGGIMSVDAAKAKPVQTIMSGPAGGAMAAAHLGQQFGHRNIITFDMGGTSSDVALILDGKLKVTGEGCPGPASNPGLYDRHQVYRRRWRVHRTRRFVRRVERWSGQCWRGPWTGVLSPTRRNADCHRCQSGVGPFTAASLLGWRDRIGHDGRLPRD